MAGKDIIEWHDAQKVQPKEGLWVLVTAIRNRKRFVSLGFCEVWDEPRHTEWYVDDEETEVTYWAELPQPKV